MFPKKKISEAKEATNRSTIDNYSEMKLIQNKLVITITISDLTKNKAIFFENSCFNIGYISITVPFLIIDYIEDDFILPLYLENYVIIDTIELNFINNQKKSILAKRIIKLNRKIAELIYKGLKNLNCQKDDFLLIASDIYYRYTNKQLLDNATVQHYI